MKEKQILNRIIVDLSGKKYGSSIFKISQDKRYGGMFVDLAISVDKKTIAIIEVVSSLKLSNILEQFSIELYFVYMTRFIAYTDGEQFIIYDRFETLNIPKRVLYKDFVLIISRRVLRSRLLELKGEIADEFIKVLLMSDFVNLKQSVSTKRSQIIEELKLGYDYRFYFANSKNDENSFEHQFFVQLLDNHVPDQIYRYGTFSRTFQIINDGKIAMLGLPGMNDTTEPNYVENYINDSNDNFWELEPDAQASINRRFIMSCTIHKDDLLQWRLYGDDAKGACIKFIVKPELKTDERFYLGRVKYANADGDHNELLLIKRFLREIRLKINFDLKFVLLHVWRHFFKPHEYNYEGEVRLLYIHRRADREKKWIIADPYSIVNPMVLFDITQNEFPLEINEYMLGPNRQERKINRSQIEQMLFENGKNISVTESERNVYR